MSLKTDVILVFIILFFLLIVAYYIGFSSDVLIGAKTIQQIAYFLTGRTSSGTYQSEQSSNVSYQTLVSTGKGAGNFYQGPLGPNWNTNNAYSTSNIQALSSYNLNPIQQALQTIALTFKGVKHNVSNVGEQPTNENIPLGISAINNAVRSVVDTLRRDLGIQ